MTASLMILPALNPAAEVELSPRIMRKLKVATMQKKKIAPRKVRVERKICII